MQQWRGECLGRLAADLLGVWRRRRETGNARGGGPSSTIRCLSWKSTSACRSRASFRVGQCRSWASVGIHSFSCELVLRSRSHVSHVSCRPPGPWSHRYSQNRHKPQARTDLRSIRTLVRTALRRGEAYSLSLWLQRLCSSLGVGTAPGIPGSGLCHDRHLRWGSREPYGLPNANPAWRHSWSCAWPCRCARRLCV